MKYAYYDIRDSINRIKAYNISSLDIIISTLCCK
nr:MAG TPA: hypothetical protein [Caudoviricetes sp.]